MNEEEKKAGLLKLRAPVAANYISKKPVPTRQQTDDLKANISLGIRCKECGGWHHKNVQHLDYMGHAAVTDRLLEVDPLWDWDYIAKDANGNPIYEQIGGLWITLTICGVTRKAYGAAEDKKGPNAIKEIIGDAIRNGAMRFGVGLELWHKGVLHLDAEGEDTQASVSEVTAEQKKMPITGERFKVALESIKSGEFTVAKLRKNFELSTDQETVVANLEKELANAGS